MGRRREEERRTRGKAPRREGEEERRSRGKKKRTQKISFAKFKRKIFQFFYADLVLVRGTSFIVSFGKRRRKIKRKIGGIKII